MQPTMQDMLKAGVHFGHQTRFWNPKMTPYIFGIHQKIHIMNLEKTLSLLNVATNVVAQIIAKRGKVLFLSTKQAAQCVIKEEATRCGMPFVNHRWLGGTLTNHKTMRKSIKRLKDLKFLVDSPKMQTLTKKEALGIVREKDKLELVLGGIEDMGGLPDALFVIDVKNERIAIKEANRLNIPVIGIVDSNCDPDGIDYIIPGNDDSVKAIRLYAQTIADTIIKVKQENKQEDEVKTAKAPEKKAEPQRKVVKRKVVAEQKSAVDTSKTEEKETAKKTATKTDSTKKPATKATVKQTASKITADQVKTLRERTQAGMMECKKALEAAEGDIEKAVEEMRKAGIARAGKKAGKIAAEGVVVLLKNRTSTAAIMIEINCQTDFVARDENFKQFTETVGKLALKAKVKSAEKLLALKMEADKDETIEDARKALVSKLGENIQIRRVHFLQSKTKIAAYQHGERIGVLVELSETNEDLGKDLAMHVAATAPQAIKPADVPKELIEKEKEIFKAQSEASGKPAEIIDKMIDGRIKKYLAQVSLEEQPFVKDPDQKISALLKTHKSEVISFMRFEVGEGIEKKEEDFAAEVMAQVKGDS